MSHIGRKLHCTCGQNGEKMPILRIVKEYWQSRAEIFHRCGLGKEYNQNLTAIKKKTSIATQTLPTTCIRDRIKTAVICVTSRRSSCPQICVTSRWSSCPQKCGTDRNGLVELREACITSQQELWIYQNVLPKENWVRTRALEQSSDRHTHPTVDNSPGCSFQLWSSKFGMTQNPMD